MSELECAAFWEQAWGNKDHRLSGILWDRKPPERYLKAVDYVRKRRDVAARREDRERIAAGLEPLWNHGYGQSGVWDEPEMKC